MANPATVAGNNGVSGINDSMSGMTSYSAVRNSVAKTHGNATVNSDVQSFTKNLRFAYTGVECDSPAVSRA